jgi:hypothetical protein
MHDEPDDLPTIEHTGFLEDISSVPACLVPPHEHPATPSGRYACAFCGVGESAVAVERRSAPSPAPTPAEALEGTMRLPRLGTPFQDGV